MSKALLDGRTPSSMPELPSEVRAQIGQWVNEGGAGGEVGQRILMTQTPDNSRAAARAAPTAKLSDLPE